MKFCESFKISYILQYRITLIIYVVPFMVACRLYEPRETVGTQIYKNRIQNDAWNLQISRHGPTICGTHVLRSIPTSNEHLYIDII